MGGGSESKKQLGKILLQQKLVSADELQEILDDQKREPGSRLASTAARKGRLSMLDALQALSAQHGVPAVDLSCEVVPLSVLRLIPVEIARERTVFPFRLEGEQLLLAMASPQEPDAVEELEFVAGKKIAPHVTLDHVVRRVIDHAYELLAQGNEYYVGAHVTEAQLAALGLPDLPRAPEPLGDEGAEEGATDARGSLAEELDQAFAQRTMTSTPPVFAKPDASARVLLAVHDPDARATLARAIADFGLALVETDDGERVLELIRDETPRVVVLELASAQVHGLDVCARLRASGRHERVPVVLLCDEPIGWRMTRDLVDNYAIEHCFEKPFDMVKLIQTVRLLVDGQEVRHELPPLSSEAEARWSSAMAAFDRGDLDAAIRELETGVDLEPHAFELHYHLGLLYGRRDQLFVAIRELEVAVRLQPLHFAAVKNLAVVYQRAGFRHKASDAWERAMTVAPDAETRANIKGHMVSLL